MKDSDETNSEVKIEIWEDGYKRERGERKKISIIQISNFESWTEISELEVRATCKWLCVFVYTVGTWDCKTHTCKTVEINNSKGKFCRYGQLWEGKKVKLQHKSLQAL